jgi:hypothetical protein
VCVDSSDYLKNYSERPLVNKDRSFRVRNLVLDYGVMIGITVKRHIHARDCRFEADLRAQKLTSRQMGLMLITLVFVVPDCRGVPLDPQPGDASWQ